MSEDVEQLALALVDLVVVPLSIPAWTGHGSRVRRAGLFPLLVLLPLLPCCIWSVCESETHTFRLTTSGLAKHKTSARGLNRPLGPTTRPRANRGSRSRRSSSAAAPVARAARRNARSSAARVPRRRPRTHT